MARTRHRLGALGGIAIAIALAGTPGVARSVSYNVRLDTSGWTGRSVILTFDLTTSKEFSQIPLPNYATILDFMHDGRYGVAETQGGLPQGDILEEQNPAAITYLSAQAPDDSLFFFSELGVRLDSLGTQVQYGIDVTEFTFLETGLWDEVSFFIRRGDGEVGFTTADPTGGHALFTIEIDGSPEGSILNVYAPMTFVPPDTLRLGLPVVGVPTPRVPGGALRFRGAAPNPAAQAVDFLFEVPAPGGEVKLEVYDAAGRLVREVTRGARAPGEGRVRWEGTGADGRRVPSGVYLARLSMGGQSAVRKVVFSR
jgi:hypothetical protein